MIVSPHTCFLETISAIMFVLIFHRAFCTINPVMLLRMALYYIFFTFECTLCVHQMEEMVVGWYRLGWL